MRPTTLTFLTTFKCTAACKECCFGCSPTINSNQLNFLDIKTIIDQVKVEFPTLEVIVFSGGECFLLGDELYKSIEYATSKGFKTRCVTNGFWGKSYNYASQVAKKLKSINLTEINFSTGDEHQEFVPISSVINAALSCAENNLFTLITIERHDHSNFSLDNLLSDRRIKNFLKKECSKNLHFMQNIWISFSNRKLAHNHLIDVQSTSNKKGCDQLFSNITITPNLEYACCCGLPLNYIKELILGKIDKNLSTYYKKSLKDFMKIWLFVDGPLGIINFMKKKFPELAIENNFAHECDACRYIYNNIYLKEKIRKIYQEIENYVFFKYFLKNKRIENVINSSKINNKMRCTM
ncbi:MAG: radical SAM/SPASM domain-containing protein [Calditrichia bacterium]